MVSLMGSATLNKTDDDNLLHFFDLSSVLTATGLGNVNKKNSYR